MKILGTILLKKTTEVGLFFGFKISFKKLCPARSTFYFMNLAREQESLVTPVL
jgi:hypothetical protein